MEAERWRRITELFEAAQQLPPGERATFLAQLDTEDCAEVGSLLAHAADDTTEGPGRLLAELAHDALGGFDVAGWVGRRLGAWRLTGVLGIGGMGVVFAAQHHALALWAAIKLVRQAVHDPLTLARFRQEQQILARLEHPNIARLYDADTIDGLPYLVMEYVEGEPLLAWCEARQTPLPARLRLFRAVCEAVQHAHRNLIVHRDLKPSNILVTAEGQPKLLDFGIAKLLGPADVEDRTATADRFMTPEYASPEQVRGDPISTATDVYALGVILSELLTGARAQPVRSLADLVRVVCEEPPRPPSVIVGVDRSRRGLARLLRGDLDTIVLTAMHKQPDRRYRSVDELAEDIRRSSEHLPITARRDSLAYRTGKFIRRNRLAVALAGMIVFGLAGGLVVTTQLARERAAAAERAEHERALAQRTTELVVDILALADPGQAGGAELTVREALAQAVTRLRDDSGTAAPEAVKARLLDVIGRTYATLSDYPAALDLLDEAGALFTRLGDEPARAEVLRTQEAILQRLGRYAEAQTRTEEALRLREVANLGDDAMDAEIHGTLALLHMQQRRERDARVEFERALTILRRMDPVDREQLAHLLRTYGDVLGDLGDAEGSRRSLEEAWTLIQAIYPANHPDAISALRTLCRDAQRRDDLEAALAHCSDGWRRAQRVFQAPHGERALMAATLAQCHLARGEHGEAARLLAGADTEAEAIFPADHPMRGRIALERALAHLHLGDPATARSQAEAARTILQAAAAAPDELAEPTLLLRVLDCRAAADAAARVAVATALQTVLARPALSPWRSALYRRSAALCPAPG